MPKSFDVTQIKRHDMYSVNPSEVIALNEDRGRFIPPTAEDVKQLAISLLTHGQRQAVQCRRVESNKLRLTMGFTRYDAVSLIRAGFEHAGQQYGDPEFLLKITVDKGINAETAFVHNVVENAHRKATSPIDDAHNQARLRTRYSYDDAKIAGLYNCSVAQVQRLEKLLNLDGAQQALVHSGELSILAALDLLQLPEANRGEVIKSVKEQKGKLTGSGVRSAVRETVEAQAAAGAPTTKTKSLARNAMEIRTFFEARAKGTGPAAEFAANMVSFVRGDITEAAMAERYEAFTHFVFPDNFPAEEKELEGVSA